MKSLKVGQKIDISELEIAETGGYLRTKRVYTIKEIYSGHVLAVDCKGNKRCICKGDLIINKIIRQEDRFEALRKGIL